MTGRLVLVATPIGNLGDLSPRAVETFNLADLIACEDTRRTGRLLRHAAIEGKELLRLDAHTEERSAAIIVERISGGSVVALVSDAGMPGISDPGERTVRRILDAGQEVEVVPGPSAPLAALAASGLPTARWCMEGFLPRKGADRAGRLAELAGERRTMVVFESPNRLAKTLADLARVLGAERRVVVAREMTKLHEQYRRGKLGDVIDAISRASDGLSPGVKGEIVLVVEGAPEAADVDDGEIRTVLAEVLALGASTKDAADETARRLGVARRRAYRLALEAQR